MSPLTFINRQIASFKLEHNVRCQADYEQAQTSIPSTGASSSSILDNKDPTSLRPAPSINPARAAMIAAGTASTISNRHDNRPAQNPDEAVRAAYAVRAAQASSGSRSSSAASLPKRQPALRPAIPSMQQYVADSARAGSSDSDIEFVGETKTAPLIEVGESYKPNELGKLAQKLSTLVNKGSEVVWTQKPGNAPRSLACKYGPGFSQDTQAGIM